MEINKDYYAILGLTPSADAVVIRAAYRALAQRYHPDKAGLSSDSARMAEINEAHEILSDPQKRAEYDRQREKTTQSADTAFADGNEEPTTRSPLDEDWQTAVQFYPELAGLRARLAKLSWKVADAFRARILQNKEFTTAAVVAERLESEFLSLYFGTNPIILAFARSLIRDERRDAARDLNQAIRVIGSSRDPEKIIAVIREKHRIQSTGINDPIEQDGRRWISAQQYARNHEMALHQVLGMVRSGDVVSFSRDGIVYIEIDKDGKLLHPNAGVYAWALAFAFLLVLALGGLIPILPSH